MQIWNAWSIIIKLSPFLKAIEKMQKEHNQGIQESNSGESQSAAETEAKQEQEGEPGTSHQLLLEYMQLDLSSLSSTAKFVETFKKTGYPLHVLICNAGIAFVNKGWLHTECQYHKSSYSPPIY